MPKLSKEQIAAKIAALQAKLGEDDDGVYEDPRTGRWFIVMRPPGRTTTTTRRRSPDGGQLLTRDQALIARGQWEAQMASGTVAVGRQRFESYWPHYLRHAKAEMTRGSYATLPAWAMAVGRPAQLIDARLLEDALLLLRSYRLRVTAAREGGHNTHGDGTALDLVPAEPVDQAAWDRSAGALARDLGWTPTGTVRSSPLRVWLEERHGVDRAAKRCFPRESAAGAGPRTNWA